MLETAKVEIAGLGGSYGVETLTLYEMAPEMGPPRREARDWPEPDGSWRWELQDFVGRLGGHDGLGATIDDAVAALAIVDAAYRGAA